MTLVIGIKCTDGVVVASDSLASYTTSTGIPTAGQPTDKIDIISDSIICSTSGPVGLGQRITHQIEQAWSNNRLSGKESPAAMGVLREVIFEPIKAEIEVARIAGQVDPGATRHCRSTTLVAIPIKKRPCLFYFDWQGSPEEATSKLPFVSIGSGQPVADPFLAFLRNIFFKNKQPNLSEGILAATWTLRYAIHAYAYGVGGAQNVVILEASDTGKNGWTARRLAEADMLEHHGQIQYMEEQLQILSNGKPKILPTADPVPTAGS